jgi:ATP-binding cassette subfamily B protein
LSSLVKSDAILVLERGEFLDMASHQALVDRCEIYSGLWHQQNGHLAGASPVTLVPRTAANGA